MSETERFDWAGDDAVIVPAQRALAVYANPRGDVVIRAERDEYEEDDPFICVAPANALAVARAMIEAAGLGPVEFVRPLGGGGYEDIEAPDVSPLALPAPAQPKDKTAAARARRYRKNKRDAERDASTLFDGEARVRLIPKEEAA